MLKNHLDVHKDILHSSLWPDGQKAKELFPLDDIAEWLEVSKPSVSTNIRLLERWKVVRRVFNRGDRKNYYEIFDIRHGWN